MNKIESFLNFKLLLLGEQSGSHLLIYGLWIGFGILAFLSMILVWTRWGQAKPLSKCIALSIFAHLLLGAYAYGTRLMFSHSDEEPVQSIAFSIVEDTSESSPDHGIEFGDPTLVVDRVDELPWEKFVELDTDGPESPSVEKIAIPQGPLPEPFVPEGKIEFRPREIDANLAIETSPRDAAETLHEGGFVIKTDKKEIADPSRIQKLEEPEKEIAKRSATPTDDENRTKIPLEPDIKSSSPENDFVQSDLESSEIIRGLQKQTKPQPRTGPATQDLKEIKSLPDPTESPLIQSVASSDFPQVKKASQAKSRSAVIKRRLADGQPIPELYQSRFAADRTLQIEQNGGLPENQEAIDKALRWLGSQQSGDGRWNPRHFNSGNEANVYGHNRGGAGFNADTGITGLVILAFQGAGHSHFEGPYQKNIQKGLEYLIRTQNQDGSLYGEAGLFARTYCHAMALMAISEAYSLTGDHRIKPFIEKAQQFTISTQNKITGGWRYRAGDDGDMSQFGWQVMALTSAEKAGFPIPTKTRELMTRFLKEYEKGIYGGLASYRPSEKPTRTMTAEALFCRRLLNLDVRRQASLEAISFVMEELPGDSKIDNLYYWYYATLALKEEQARGGSDPEEWRKWYRKLSQRLLALQESEPGRSGSFSSSTLWSPYGGSFYTTAMSTLSLEIPYRFNNNSVPIHRTARSGR